VEGGHLAPEVVDLIFGQHARQEAAAGRLFVEADPAAAIAIPIGVDLAVAAEHARQQLLVAGAVQGVAPLLDALVILTEVHVRAVTRDFGEQAAAALEAHVIDAIGGDARAGLDQRDDRIARAVVGPGVVHDADRGVFHSGAELS
jgi:hypothetical protein